MFRIKTDIRQYKCETHEKVEKLIRNWVIRPNDLIYHQDHKAWRPIGEHPAFLKLFALLEEHERAEPDTVVTTQNSVQRGGDAGSAVLELAVSEDVTQMTSRPGPIAGAAHSTSRAAVAERSGGDAAEDVLDAPEPPVAPPGIESPARDEVTVMTEKTLDRMRADDQVAPGLPTDSDGEEEVTGLHPHLDGDEAASEEKTEIRMRPAVSDSADDLEVTGDPERDDDDAPRADAPQAAILKPKKVGRHDLPEEFFATNEISSPITRESVAALDELGELSETSEGDDDATGRARWNIQLGTPPSDATDDEASPLEASGDISCDPGAPDALPTGSEGLHESSDLRETQPVSDVTDDGAESVADQVARALRDTDELEADEDETREEGLAPTVGDEGEDEQDEASAQGDGYDGEDDSSWQEELDEVVEIATAYDPDEELEEIEDLEEIDIEAAATHRLADFISEGYKLPLPFEVVPSQENIAAGLARSTAPTAAKDRTYPYPVPKKLRALETRNFDLDREPPRDQSIALMIGVGALLLLAVISLAMC